VKYPRARILIFTRPPVPGQVKRRLARTIGDERAAQLHADMLRHVVAVAARAALAPVRLYVTSDEQHALFVGLQREFAIGVFRQAGGDLGERMFHALHAALRECDCALLIGSDCPLIDDAYLEDALQRLQKGADVVIGPARDGGYVLIGMREPCRTVFRDIAWGSAEVMAMTRLRCARAGLTCSELPALFDIDTAADLKDLGIVLPQSRLWLQAVGL
jgi:rSAM/selenodomain-associated transferase 1